MEKEQELKLKSLCNEKFTSFSLTYFGSAVSIFFSTPILDLVLSINTRDPQLTYKRLSLCDTSIHLTTSLALPGVKHIGMAFSS